MDIPKKKKMASPHIEFFCLVRSAEKLNTNQCKGDMALNDCVNGLAAKWLQFHSYWLNKWGKIF